MDLRSRRVFKWAMRGLMSIAIAFVVYFVIIIAMFIPAQLLENRATTARADIHDMEVATVKLLSDAGMVSLTGLFDTAKVASAIGATAGSSWRPDQFVLVRAIYTNCYTKLLREGRFAAQSTEQIPDVGVTVGELLDKDVVKRLGQSYLAIGLDPWGQAYQVFPGPWPDELGPILFRRYRALEGEATAPDAMTIRGRCGDE